MKKLLTFLITATFVVATLVYVGKQQPVLPPVPQQQQIQPPSLPAADFETAKRNINEQRIRNNLVFLCKPDLEGRMSGKRGNETSAEFIVRQFTEMGLKPAFGNTYLQPFKINNVNNHKEQGSGQTANVVGVIPGGPRCIVVGAHFDHIGYGPSMSRAPNRREIHPGADDNASGTCALLEVAKAFVSLKGQNKHTIYICSFSAEEMGLLGADYFCANPPVPLDQIDFMLNFDIVGRYRDNLGVYGAGASSELKQAAQQATCGIKLNITNSTGGGSDHASFARKGVPVTFLHTGLHSDYHTPDDTPEKINYTGVTESARYAFHFCWLVDKMESRPRQYLDIPKTWSDHDYESSKCR